MACGKGILESVMKVVIWCLDSPEKHFAEVIELCFFTVML